MNIPIKQILLEMAMNQFTYLGSTEPNRNGDSRHFYGVEGDGKDNDAGHKTILYQSTGNNSDQKNKFFGTTGININPDEKDFKPLLPQNQNAQPNWIQKYSILGHKNDSGNLSIISHNPYLDTKGTGIHNDHPKVKEAREFMDTKVVSSPSNINILNSRNINFNIRKFLKG